MIFPFGRDRLLGIARVWPERKDVQSKDDHGLSYGYANLVASTTLNPPAESLLEMQYAGPKAGLRRIYDEIAWAVDAFGPDVKLSPQKTYVSLRR
ncbi:MAG: hypothetical protein R3335_13575, partial [Anaerolineales bacterium]|nr:hypothetical protein [Anaerolineales bacterium]